MPRDHGVDLVAVALGVLEAAEREHRHALAEDGAVGLVGERPAVAAPREGRRLREAHEHQDVVEGVDAAGDHHVGFAEIELRQADLERRQ